MPTERVIEIPWAMMQLPQSGTILDVGSCDADYLGIIQQSDRALHCLDPRECRGAVPQGARFFHESIIGNRLPSEQYDAVLLLSVLEHIGLPCYGQRAFAGGDRLTLTEVKRLLKPGCPLIATVPVGQAKTTSWYRQYTPAGLRDLFTGWRFSITYWVFRDNRYIEADEHEAVLQDYRDQPFVVGAGAGALGGIVAHRE